MRINPVNSTPSKIDFKSNIFESFNPTETQQKSSFDNSKVMLAVTGLGILGIASVALAVLKNKNPHPIQRVQKAVKHMHNKHIIKQSNKCKPDPVCIILDGKRDSEALRIYRACSAREKLQSLENKFKSGEFIGRTEALDYINSNKEQLQRISRNVI